MSAVYGGEGVGAPSFGLCSYQKFGASRSTGALDSEVGSCAEPIPFGVVSQLGLADLISMLVAVSASISASVLSDPTCRLRQLLLRLRIFSSCLPYQRTDAPTLTPTRTMPELRVCMIDTYASCVRTGLFDVRLVALRFERLC
jgi:hypothetical protein